MVGFFTGTATGQMYKVGQKYRGTDNRGRETTFTAQKDGTFKQDDTGQVRVGASKNPEARFYTTRRSGNGVVRTAAPGKGGAGPGVAAAQTPGAAPGAGGSGAGSQVVVSGPRQGGMSMSVLDWKTPDAWNKAPEIDGIANKPLERIGIGAAQEAPGAISDIGWTRTHTGGWIVVPSADVKERIEDDLFTQSQWSWRNVWGPSIGVIPQPKPDHLDPARHQFDFWSGEWRVGSGAGRQTRNGSVFTGGGF